GLDPETLESELGEGWDARNLAVPTGSSAIQLHLAIPHIRKGDVVVLGVLPQTFYTESRSLQMSRFESKLPSAQGTSQLDLWIITNLQSHVWMFRRNTSPTDEARNYAREAIREATPNEESDSKLVARSDGWLELLQPTGVKFNPD